MQVVGDPGRVRNSIGVLALWMHPVHGWSSDPRVTHRLRGNRDERVENGLVIQVSVPYDTGQWGTW